MILPPNASAKTKRIRVVLAIDSGPQRARYAAAIHRQPDMELVGTAVDPIDLLLLIRRTNAHVVLLPWTEDGGVPGICTHLFAEFGELLVVGITTDGKPGGICQQRIVQTPLRMDSSHSIWNVIRENCDADLVAASTSDPTYCD